MKRATAVTMAMLLSVAVVTGPSSPVDPGLLPPEPPSFQRPIAKPDVGGEPFVAPDVDPTEPAGPVGAVPFSIFLANTAAHVIPVGLNPDGSMEVPDDVHAVGWYTLTNVRPGDPGTAVLAGHVDSRTQGRGVFYDLVNLRVGDEITIDTADGPQLWIVSSTETHRRSELPIAEVFSLDGEPRLALVTCGGEFDSAIRSYRDNVVVYAHLADETHTAGRVLTRG